MRDEAVPRRTAKVAPGVKQKKTEEKKKKEEEKKKKEEQEEEEEEEKKKTKSSLHSYAAYSHQGYSERIQIHVQTWTIKSINYNQ